MRSRRIRQQVYTRRLYSFEHTFLRGEFKPTPMIVLQTIARVICPQATVVAGRGCRDARGGWTSYARGRNIVLARRHRNICVLLHEIAHVQEYRGLDHGPAFRERFFSLIEKCTHLDIEYLQLAWDMLKITTRRR